MIGYLLVVSPVVQIISPSQASFNGNGYSINGLTIDKPETDYVGLFGYTEGAIIENVALKNVYITGRDYTGGLVGIAASSSNITNSYWDKETTGRNSSAGGGLGKPTNDMKMKGNYKGWEFDTIGK